MVGECQEGGSSEGSIGARTSADCRGDMPDTSLRRKDVCASESANKASQVASFFQRSSQPPALAPRLRVSQGHQLVVGEIVQSLCPKVSESSGLVGLVELVGWSPQQSVISPDPCLGLPMQKIHQSAHLSGLCTRNATIFALRKSLPFPSKQLLLKVFAERGEEASRKHFSTRPLPEHESVIQNLGGGPSMQGSPLLR